MHNILATPLTRLAAPAAKQVAKDVAHATARAAAGHVLDTLLTILQEAEARRAFNDVQC